jgi:hypothetical protein
MDRSDKPHRPVGTVGEGPVVLAVRGVHLLVHPVVGLVSLVGKKAQELAQFVVLHPVSVLDGLCTRLDLVDNFLKCAELLEDRDFLVWGEIAHTLTVDGPTHSVKASLDDASGRTRAFLSIAGPKWKRSSRLAAIR